MKPETAIMTLGDWIGDPDGYVHIDKLKVDAHWSDLAS